MPAVDESQGIAAVKYMDLPVLGPPDAEGQRAYYPSQFDFNAYIGCHPCFTNPAKYTTVFMGAGVVDVAVPYPQFVKIMTEAGQALAAQVDEHKGKKIVLATSIPRKGGL